MKYVLYNGLAKSSNNQDLIKDYVNTLGENVQVLNVIELIDYQVFFAGLTESDEVHLLGGDGTLNNFINITNRQGLLTSLPCKFYFHGSGTGNDFLFDVREEADNNTVCLNEYIKNLPTVKVCDKEYLFINGVGYGIDGYCCEVADEIHARSNKPVNYASIAIKGILFFFKRSNATVFVDGVKRTYKKVYLASTMKGRYYGGGMLIAPKQNRHDPDQSLSVVVLHGCSRLKALMIFSSIFKGEHVKHTKNVEIIEGHNVTVEFDTPTALQIDGETVKGVTSYQVYKR